MKMKCNMCAWVMVVMTMPLCGVSAVVTALHSYVPGDDGLSQNAPKYQTFILDGQTYDAVKLSLERGFVNDVYSAAIESHTMDSYSMWSGYYYRNDTSWGLSFSTDKTYYAVMLHSSDSGIDYYAVFSPVKGEKYGLTFSMVNGQEQTGWLKYVERTKTEYRSVPYGWLKSYYTSTPHNYDAYENLAKSTSANGRDSVGACYVAGLNPTNNESVFRAVLRMEGDVPIVSWKPNLNTNGEIRTYKVWGSESLEDLNWEFPTNSLHRFFKVTVEMRGESK